MLADIQWTVYPEEVTRQLHFMAQATESSTVTVLTTVLRHQLNMYVFERGSGIIFYHFPYEKMVSMSIVSKKARYTYTMFDSMVVRYETMTLDDL